MRKELEQKMHERTLRPIKPNALKVGTKPAIEPKPKLPSSKCNQAQSFNTPFAKSPKVPSKPNFSKVNTTSQSNTSRNFQSKPKLEVSNSSTATCKEKNLKLSQNVGPRALLSNPNNFIEEAIQQKDNVSCSDYIDMSGTKLTASKNFSSKPVVGSRGNFSNRLIKVFPPELTKVGNDSIDIHVDKAKSRGTSPVQVIKRSDEEYDGIYENPPDLNELTMNEKMSPISNFGSRSHVLLSLGTTPRENNSMTIPVNRAKTNRGPSPHFTKKVSEKNQVVGHENSYQRLPLPPRLTTKNAGNAENSIARNLTTNKGTENQQENVATSCDDDEQNHYEDVDQPCAPPKSNVIKQGLKSNVNKQGTLHIGPNNSNPSLQIAMNLPKPPIKTKNISNLSNKKGLQPVATFYPEITVDNKNSNDSENFLPEETYAAVEDSVDSPSNSYLVSKILLTCTKVYSSLFSRDFGNIFFNFFRLYKTRYNSSKGHVLFFIHSTPIIYKQS